MHALAADTDGVEDNAGAFVAPDTLSRALAVGMKLDHYLDRNDAYGYFDKLDDLVVSGPTYTNVNDFRALLILQERCIVRLRPLIVTLLSGQPGEPVQRAAACVSGGLGRAASWVFW